MTTAAVDTNSGGRVSFAMGTPVRFIELDGSLSKSVYVTDQERSDRKGHVLLREQTGTRTVRVHYRRILIAAAVDGKAVVVESHDQLWALCPEEGQPVAVKAGDDAMVCPQCSKSYPLHWMGVKPMADAAKTAEKPAKEKGPKPEKAKAAAPKTAAPKREPKPPREPITVDLNAMAKLPHCELYTKSNVKFDHHSIDVKAHVLLCVGTNPRKLCFNTYNGTLGKKATELPIDAFVKGETVKTGKKDTPWFPVPDLDKARTKLQKDGYELAK